MRVRLRQLLEQTGITSTFEASGFAQAVEVDGCVTFTYRSFDFMFHLPRHIPRLADGLIYCDQYITDRYGPDVLPEWKRDLSPEDLPDLKRKLEDVYIPNIMKIQIEFPLDFAFEEMKDYLVPRFGEIGYQFFDEYSGNKMLNINYNRPGSRIEFTAVAFIKGIKVARVLVAKRVARVFVDLLWYPENLANPRMIKLWHRCVSPFVSKYELLDGLVRWVRENEDRLERCDDTATAGKGADLI